MTHMSRDGLVVARRPGTRLFLTGDRNSPSLEGLSEYAILFRPESFERELAKMRVPRESVVAVPVSIEFHVG